MSMPTRETSSPPLERPRYIAPVAPVVFPESAEVPETQLHLDLRTLLYHLLQDFFEASVTVGSQARQAALDAGRAEAEARQAAELRVKELEAELRRRG